MFVLIYLAICYVLKIGARDSVVGIAARHGLDCHYIEFG
jgi:hypothetical protein